MSAWVMFVNKLSSTYKSFSQNSNQRIIADSFNPPSFFICSQKAEELASSWLQWNRWWIKGKDNNEMDVGMDKHYPKIIHYHFCQLLTSLLDVWTQDVKDGYLHDGSLVSKKIMGAVIQQGSYMSWKTWKVVEFFRPKES